MTYFYSPRRHPPPLPRAQQERNRAWITWDRAHDRLMAQGCDLLLAGRVEEFGEFERDVIKPHKAAEPNVYAA